LKQNRNPDLAEELNHALSFAQEAFDIAASDQFIANMFYERLLE